MGTTRRVAPPEVPTAEGAIAVAERSTDEPGDDANSTAAVPSSAVAIGTGASPAEGPSPTAVVPDPSSAPKELSSSPAVESPDRATSGRAEQFLGFRLDREEYCVWIRSIKEIIRPPEITPIPRSPSDILGLISLRGTIVPILNIRRRLGLSGGSVGPKSRIVVVVLDAGPVGMVVDHVTEVISMDPDALEPPPPTMGEREASLVTATVRVQDRIIGVLHLERLVAIDAEAPLRAVA
jgi:purine-binding chemotaxis protein CheW